MCFDIIDNVVFAIPCTPQCGIPSYIGINIDCCFPLIGILVMLRCRHWPLLHVVCSVCLSLAGCLLSVSLSVSLDAQNSVSLGAEQQKYKSTALSLV